MQKMLIKNRKAFHDYEILETLESGVVLFGHEVKSLKNGQGNFTGSFISLSNGEAWLKNFHVSLYEKATTVEPDPDRPKKLLLHKKELAMLEKNLKTKGNTIIPLACGLHKGKIKFEIALVRGKKNYDKRESLKQKDQDRRVRAAIKDY